MPIHGADAGHMPAELMSIGAVADDRILQRNTAAFEVPDQRYWTGYDYYMMEREARAMHTARMRALFAEGWRALSRRLFG